MLLLQDSPHRLSIDIDIMCPPGTNIENIYQSMRNVVLLSTNLLNADKPEQIFRKVIVSFFIRLRSEMILIVQHIFYWMSCSKTATMNKLLKLKLIALSLKLPVAGL